MTYKNCIHYEVCNAECGELLSRINQGCEQCKHFKDKSLIVELPCKVGKEIYVLNRENIPQRMILDEPDIRCHCAKEVNLCMALCDDKEHSICVYRFKNDGSDIGEKVFRTKEEAEAKLKELENESKHIRN